MAVVEVEAEHLSRIVGAPLANGTEPGLGSWQAIGPEFPGGLLVELIQHAHAPVAKGFEIRVDGSCNSELALGQVVKPLAVPRHCRGLSQVSGPNYVSKPTADNMLRSSAARSRSVGLTRRYAL